MKKLLLFAPLLATTASALTIANPVVNQRQLNTSGLKIFSLLDAANEHSGNLAFSPYSATTAMQMVIYGTDIEEQKSKTFNELKIFMPPYFIPQPPKIDGVSVVNAAFSHNTFTPLPKFTNALDKFFQAHFQILDFTQPEPARATINAWVAEQTNDKIQNLLPPNSLTADSRLVLVNALYFNDDWLTQFPAHNTRPRAFNSASGAVREIPFMHNTARFNYAERDNVQILQLPYKNGCVMTLLLPRGNDLAPAFALLNQNLGNDLQPARVSVALPKFTLNWQGSLKAALQHLGIREAFTRNADFSRITRDEKLFITDVFQAVFIAVDERGTEAAAATGVGFAVTSIDLNQPIEFTADRPFLFTLATPDNTLLFTGVVREP